MQGRSWHRWAAPALGARLPWFVGAWLLVAASAPAAGAAEPSADQAAFFEQRIRPLLVQHCYECHSAASKKRKGGLWLDTRDHLRAGGDSGSALVPGDPDKSLLIRAVRQTDKELRMPPKSKLSEAELADLAAWVKMGAPDPRRAGADTARTAPAKHGMSLEEGRKFWSLQPIRKPPLPAVRAVGWPKTPVDHFILARLESAGVAPAPQADRRTLLRRATFDLTGLPPTPAELAAFLADESPRAFETVVDRLLASPRYGERWGRHWLDVVRYADTCGNASDYPVPQAQRYRDWVIRAFNRDLPYDEFLREQVAGDLLPGGSEAERVERVTATGYLAIARRFGGDRLGEHHLTIEDTIDNLGRAVLGFSISCARCHDHKFDPFTMGDYYGLYGIFSSTRYPHPGAEVGNRQEDFVPLLPAAEIEARLKPHRAKVAALQAEIQQLEAAAAAAKKAPAGADQRSRLEASAQALAAARQALTKLQAAAPEIPDAYAVAEGRPANARMHIRGDPRRLGDEAPRRFPAVLGAQTLPRDCTASGRLQLAHWLTDPANPLPARVIVNRIWQHHFGKGIVPTPNDFGRQGQPPTHPELLDFLASRFMADGWSIKALHRLILLSRTWQLASTGATAQDSPDPTNALFGRFARRRLDAEALRDTLLFVSGALDESAPRAHPFPPSASWRFTQHSPFVAVYESRQRSVYLMQQRQRKHPYLALFDGADPSSSTGTRLPSTTPLQALFHMNDPLVHEMARRFAERVAAVDAAARLEFAYQLALNRSPAPDETAECVQFLRGYRERLAALKTPDGQGELLAWTALARALLSSNEMVFVD